MFRREGKQAYLSICLLAGFQIKIWSQLPRGQPISEIKLPPRKFTCPSFFVYFHVVISSYLKIYDM